MIFQKQISEEAEELLAILLENKADASFWKRKMENEREKAITWGCLKELKDCDLISYAEADNIPYALSIKKEGYLYFEHKKKIKRASMTEFERRLYELLDRTKDINPPMSYVTKGTDIDQYNQPSEIWVNDFEIFYNRYLTDHPFSQRIRTTLIHRNLNAYKDLVGMLQSISADIDYIDQKNNVTKVMVSGYQKKLIPEYDVFISHANKDKIVFVEELKKSLEKLGIKIFYDKDTLEWGDNWKERILNGVEKSEFAIIVISENFFDRKWTEKELREFLSRQNRNGQKIILPIIHNITMEQLSEKYPAVADIQAIDSRNYSADEIALLFAEQLIKRLKSI